MKSRLFLSVAMVLVTVALAYGKHEKMPLPAQLVQAKTIYIDNRSGLADIGDRCYDELRKWGRFQVVDSPQKADIVLLFSASRYISGYSSGAYQTTNGSIDSGGNISTQTYGNGSSHAIVRGTTYVTVVDPKDGSSLWSDARAWGFKSATRGLVKELRDRIEHQESGK
jgi:hypothetical protein